ncbi:MAG: zinc-ribbon and DUF3426 domain-containing protein [Wenzhouxiangella sp.]|jgi:predicted Zn finger-like uncharacterized protein|nr:zinc-ribbon and DUF3426 domain-containing protein [Wenzhouxiangella sp.]
MPVYTRCPACEATYELQVQEMAEAAGVVRCSNCGKTFNSLAFLFDQRPDEQQQPLRGAGMPPLLGQRIFLQHELPGLDEPAASPAAPEPKPEKPEIAAPDSMDGIPEPSTWPWMAAAGLLGVILIAQSIWLIDVPGRLMLGEASGAVPPQEAISLIARDLHAHPSLPEAVVISATLRNRIADQIALPLIELRLYDSSNQVIGARRFGPSEYLPAARREDLHLQPGRDLPIILEVMVTGSQPAGFEFRYL